MRIILAIDDSQFSADAVREVAATPWPPDTTVRVLSAAEPVTPPPASELWYDAGGGLDQPQLRRGGAGDQPARRPGR